MSKYLIETILPANEIHLVAGPSGAGKTRWLMHTLLKWERGESIFGYRSYPVPWVYVAADRSIESVGRTLTSIDIDPKHLNIIPSWDERHTWSQVLDSIGKSKAKLAVIESFGSFVDPPANGACVKNFLARTGAAVRYGDVTFIGINESPKMKPADKYELARQRISGPAAWGHFSETVFMVEPADPRHAELGTRTLTICPRNGPEQVFKSAFDSDGRLIFV